MRYNVDSDANPETHDWWTDGQLQYCEQANEVTGVNDAPLVLLNKLGDKQELVNCTSIIISSEYRI